MTSAFHRVCRLDELPLNEGRAFDVKGHRVAVFRVPDGVYAIDDLCTHGDASLADGFVENGEVECPYHSGCFALKTGLATRAPAFAPVQCHTVKVDDDGNVLVRLGQNGA